MIKRWMVAVCLVLTLLMAGASSVWAQSPPSSPGRSAPLNCARFNDSVGQVFPNLKGAAFGVIVPCISRVLETAGTDMTAAMVDYMRPIFYSFLVLVIVLQGITAVQGEGQMGPRTMLLLLKIAAVAYFVEAFGGNVPNLITIADIFDIMDSTADIMATAMLPAGGSQGFTCEWQQYMPSNPRPSSILWAQMDCALGKVLGFAMGQNGQPNMILATSVLGMLGGFFFGGTFGVTVFFMGVGFIISLLLFVIRVGFAYLNAYFLATIYLIISPIFIPLALIRQTTQYFQNWTRGMVGAVMMPVIVTTYSIFALLVFDKILFTPNSTLHQLMDYRIIQDSLGTAKTIDCGTALSNAQGYSRVRGVEQQQGQGALATANRNPTLGTFDNGACKVQVVNLELARSRLEMPDGEASREKAIYTRLLVDLTKMMLVCFVMISGWRTVQSVMTVLTESGAATAPIANADQAIQSRAQAAENNMKGVFNVQPKEGEQSGPGGLAGTAFIEQLPTALAEGAKTFVLGGSNR